MSGKGRSQHDDTRPDLRECEADPVREVVRGPDPRSYGQRNRQRSISRRRMEHRTDIPGRVRQEKPMKSIEELAKAIGWIAGIITGVLIANYIIFPALLGGTLSEVVQAL